MLFVVEGLDGSGKSTQVAMLRKHLEERCGKVEYIHFPRYDAPVYGDLIGKFLRGGFGSIDAVHPQLVALLYALDRHDAAPSMRKTLSEGGTVLLDRYVYSNIAYQCAKVADKAEREELRKWILDTEYGFYDLPKPDLNIFLDVPSGFVKSQLTSDRDGADRSYLEGHKDIHESSLAFQEKVRKVYLDQCGRDPHFERIDCSAPDGSMMDPGEIFARLRERVDKLL
jgi:dTMP kinase